MNRYFFDTSALVKIYHREEGSDYCLARYVDQSPLIISELARVELHSAIFRKQREKELSAKALKAVLQRFECDCEERYEFSMSPRLSMTRRADCFPDTPALMGSGRLTVFSLQLF